MPVCIDGRQQLYLSLMRTQLTYIYHITYIHRNGETEDRTNSNSTTEEEVLLLEEDHARGAEETESVQDTRKR